MASCLQELCTPNQTLYWSHWCAKLCLNVNTMIEAGELSYISTYQMLSADKIGKVNKLARTSLKSWTHTCARRGNAVNRFTPIAVWARNKKLPLHGIPTVGIVQNVPSIPTQLSHTHHHHGSAVCPSYDVGSMDPPNLTQVTSLKGVKQGHLVGWV